MTCPVPDVLELPLVPTMPETRYKTPRFTSDLCVMTLNMQYYSAYPKDPQVGWRRMKEITAGADRPDILCVQEGLDGTCEIELATSGLYRRLVNSVQHAQSVSDMAYGDASIIENVPEFLRDRLLVNEVYVRADSNSWVVVDHGVERISSRLNLTGGPGTGRVSGPLAVRSVVWVKLAVPGTEQSGPFAFVLNTHFSGGRLEDQFFVQQLSGERLRQTERAMDVFHRLAGVGDFGVLVGDFNAALECSWDGSAIITSRGVLRDQFTHGFSRHELEIRFCEYMTSPFQALRNKLWHLAYNEASVGPTSAFGHLVDHMAMSYAVPVRSDRLIATNQIGSIIKDTEEPISDHNAVRTVFRLTAARPTPFSTMPISDHARRALSNPCVEVESSLSDLDASICLLSTESSRCGATPATLQLSSAPSPSDSQANAEATQTLCYSADTSWSSSGCSLTPPSQLGVTVAALPPQWIVHRKA